MPANKSALLRYRIIDSCLTNPQKKYPTMDYIVQKIEEQLDTTISNSMFTKDIDNMRRIYSAPIKYIRAEKGYCYTESDFSVSSFPLSHAEIEALDYSTALLNQLKGTSMLQQFENAINKVIEGYRISKIIGRSEKMILQIEEPLKTEANIWLERILKAIVNREQLTVTYQGFQREAKTHGFSPYLLKEYRNRWYTVGYSEIAKDILILALDRIQDITIKKGRYHAAEDFDPAAFFKYSLGITQINHINPEKVVLSFTPFQAAYIRSQPLHETQKITLENDKEVRVEMELYLTQELKMMILSYGAEVKVLEPKKLKSQIQKSIKKMQALYQ